MFTINPILKLMTKSNQGKSEVIRAVTPIPNPQRGKNMSKLLKQTGAAKRLLAAKQKQVIEHRLVTDYEMDGYCSDDYLNGPILWNDIAELYRGYVHVFYSRDGRGAEHVVFGDLEQPHFKASNLKAMRKDELIGCHVNLFHPYPHHRLRYKTKAELIEGLLEATVLDFYNYIGLNKGMWRGLASTYTLPVYSQGDAVKVRVKVLVLDTMPEDLPAPSKDHLHKLLFDNSIRGKFHFRGESYCLEELLDDPYQFDNAQGLTQALIEALYEEANEYNHPADRKELSEALAAMRAERS